MCRAHVIRFSCRHGLLLSLEACREGPCPLLKSTSNKLPQQPRKCYSCQKKIDESNATTPNSSQNSSCQSSLDSATNDDYPIRPVISNSTPPKSRANGMRNISCQADATATPFSFTCASEHTLPPHYGILPSFLPHQSHDCPCCQFQIIREKNDRDAIRDAQAVWPLVKEERIKGGRPECEWKGVEGYERYLDDRRLEEKEMLFVVARKWEQDLKNMKVFMSEEDGVTLLG